MKYIIYKILNLFILSGFLLGLPACHSGSLRDPQEKPNVIIILTDDQGWGDLSYHGNTNLQTPNIDRLAERGTTFDRFYVCPVCSPTRAELLTGRYHTRSGVYSTSAGGERMDTDETTMAEVFKAAGYATAAYGKWHNGMQHPYHPNARGFDDYYGFCSGHWGNYFSPMLEHNGRIVKGNGFIIDDLTDRAIDFIEANRENPFFVYIPYNTPHGPMQVPDEYWDRQKDSPLNMRHREPEKEDLMFTRAALAMCENIDYNVGRIMQKLYEAGLEENTIVLYMIDNGPNSARWNDGMKGRKGSTDEGGVRSPLFLQWKGTIREGKEIPDIASAIDLLPTLADLAGIPVQGTKPLDGISLKPLIMEGQNPDPERIIFSHWRGRVSARNQQFRLDHNGQLFNMIDDPGQHTNVAEQFPEKAQAMTEAIDEWKRNVMAEIPEKDERTFPIGFPGARYTQIPARDGVGHGNLVRSNRFPNCSFYTNWTSIDDRITWDVEVPASGDFKVTLYYTCSEEAVGTEFRLSFNESSVLGTITEAYDPPLFGMDDDRVERHNSYVKDWKTMELPVLHLEQGTGQLVLQALDIPGSRAMDFRLLMFERI